MRSHINLTILYGGITINILWFDNDFFISELPWFVFVYTGSKKNAGTNANVSMVVYGDNGKSDQISLTNNNPNFKQGATDEFKISMIDIGIPYKIRIWHNNSGSFSGWFLEKVGFIVLISVICLFFVSKVIYAVYLFYLFSFCLNKSKKQKYNK